MSENETLELVPLKQTALMKIKTEDSTVLIDTAAELNKGYYWLNVLIDEVVNQRHIESVEDDTGNFYERTKFHPLTMKLFEERRKTLELIHKISGGEIRNEIKKELGKLSAKAIFDASKNPKTKEEFINQAKSIIEAEFDENRT